MAANPAAAAQIDVPAHIPRDLVRNIDLWAEMDDTPNPFLTAHELRDGRDIFWSPSVGRLGPLWVITRADHLRQLLMDTKTFTSEGIVGYAEIMGEAWHLTPLEMDPPEHGKYRTLINPLFSPKRMAALDVQTRSLCGAIIDGLLDRGECEFDADFCRQFPVRVFLGLMGWPQDKATQFNTWMRGLGGHADSIRQAGLQVRDYLQARIDTQRETPDENDVITYLLGCQVEGRPLTANEIMGMCFLLYVGGLNTVAGSLGYTFLHFARDQEHQAWLREDPSRIPAAVEEILRVYPVVITRRFVAEDTVFQGVAMKKGDGILIAPHFANYDESLFADPTAIDLARKANRHVSFSFGPHHCVGNHLARRELAIALQEWFARTERFWIKEGTTPRTHAWGSSSVMDLQLEWTVKK